MAGFSPPRGLFLPTGGRLPRLSQDRAPVRARTHSPASLAPPVPPQHQPRAAGRPTQGDETHPPPLLQIPNLIDAVAGRTLAFPVTASDPDGDTVTTSADTSDFPATNLPQFAAPAFSWTPTADSARELPYTARF